MSSSSASKAEASTGTMVQPSIELLSSALVQRILDEAFQLMSKPGIKVLSSRARDLLHSGGAQVGSSTDVMRIPERTVRAALETAPKSFELYDQQGRRSVTYGGNAVQFDPGSSAVHVLDPDTLEHRSAKTADLVRLVKVAELLPEYAAQSTAVICADVPAAIGKGGKNVSAIVNKIGIGIDIKPRSEFDRQQVQPQKSEAEFNLGSGIKIQTDKKQLTIVAPEQSGKIVDVFAGKEYLFTATVNEMGEIHLAKNSSIAQEMIRRYQNSEIIKLRPV